MKKDANEHSKIWDLAARLKVDQPLAVGLMENLWHWSAKEIPDGGIGKRTNDMIADRIHLPRRIKPDQLIEAMVDSGLLDEMSGCRLYIHDWEEHCEDTVHKKMARSGLYFANGKKPSLNRLPITEKNEIIKKFYTDERTESAQRAHGVRTESALSAPKERSQCALPMPMPMPKSSPYPLTEEEGKSTVCRSEIADQEVSPMVVTCRKAFEVLIDCVNLTGLTFEHVANAARAFPDIDLVAESKKMAKKAENFRAGLDEPGLWVWSWLQNCKPEKPTAPRERPFDPSKDM